MHVAMKVGDYPEIYKWSIDTDICVVHVHTSTAICSL